MDQIRTYLISVIAMAIICGIAMKLIGEKGSKGAIMKLIVGASMTFAVISPVAKIRLSELSDITEGYAIDGEVAASEGIQITSNALRERIKAQSEAYILEEANALGSDLTVTVTLSEDEIPVPASVQLSGQISPFGKRKLTTIIEQDLGIGKEAQSWI